MSWVFIVGFIIFEILAPVFLWFGEYDVAAILYCAAFIMSMIWNAVDVIGERLDNV